MVQRQRGGILGSELRLTVDRPLDSQRGVVPEQASLVFRGVVGGGLVEEFRSFTKHDEAVGKTLRHPELLLVFCAQMHADPLPEGFRAFSEVDRNIEDFALHDADEFALGVLDLVMQAAQHVLCRLRMVVLDELAIQAGGLLEGAGVEAFEEEAAVVPKDFRFEDEHVGNGGGDSLHLSCVLGDGQVTNSMFFGLVIICCPTCALSSRQGDTLIQRYE